MCTLQTLQAQHVEPDHDAAYALCRETLAYNHNACQFVEASRKVLSSCSKREYQYTLG